MVVGSGSVRVADNFSPSDTQSGGLFPHKSSAPFFLLRGRRLSDARTKCCLSTRVWLLALRLLVGACARATAEPRRIRELMRRVESAMACGLILLWQPSVRPCKRRTTTLLWLLSCCCSMCAVKVDLHYRRPIPLLSRMLAPRSASNQ